MSFFIILLTFALVVNCGVLVLLILVQQPKKDSGAGLAFGGGTADALFGAGSGNALTKITKWATVTFVGLALLLGMVQVKAARGNASAFQNAVQAAQQGQQTPQLAPPPQSQPQPMATPNSANPAPAPGVLPLPATTNATPPATTTSTNGK